MEWMYVMYEIGLFMIALTGIALAVYLVNSGVDEWRKSREVRRERKAFDDAQTDALEAVLNATDEVRLARQLIEREKK